MMLIILDKDPYQAAALIPRSVQCKQLLELCQLTCSTNISSVYKPIPQGKQIREWILNNLEWTYCFMYKLTELTRQRFQPESFKRILSIRSDLSKVCGPNSYKWTRTSTAVLRYSEKYKGASVPTNTTLPIEQAVREYQRYTDYKIETKAWYN